MVPVNVWIFGIRISVIKNTATPKMNTSLTIYVGQNDRCSPPRRKDTSAILKQHIPVRALSTEEIRA